ncbi:NACHT domain-containing protein [Fusarium keratoplasticum]|uniref:NACHT domain-containing protein n=1 Tax=Fusarium keratoplasticum TaxID=1328300 RepID=A0ACC0RDY5_9HYPO|nr:NACHT domain-containing protein [Fusarium keratoplasticum]KAI8680532.1 NACHT domain-containing protein [Fusarium keratoplasticum]KAI8686584.1 NACHT domain-containing protein [Fusarium keratoplasticum]
MSHTTFQGPLRGEYVIAGAHASTGGAIHFNFGADAPPRSIRPFSTVPFPPDPKFVERTDILLWLRDQTALPGSRAALVGLGGIGKSQVAIHYAHEVRRASPDTWVFWVHASSRARFEEAYRNIADKLQLPGRDDPQRNVLQLVHAWLCDEENGPWMMVLDNADSVEVFFPSWGAHGSRDQPLASFLPKTGCGSIIITSRNTDAAERLAGLDATYNVPTMEKSQALQLLQIRLGEDGAEDNVAMSDLVDVLNYMPLAITQAAAFINRRAPRMSISKYLDEFRRSDKKRANLLNRDAGDLRRDESASNSIVTTWQITFDQIRHERPSAANLLSFMSFFNSQGIPESVLRAYIQDQLEGGEDDFEEDLETLRGYSLVAVTADNESFEMHALVQFCTRLWLSSDKIQRWKRAFLRAVADQYPTGNYENWVKCQSLDPHIEGIIQEKPDDSRDVLWWAMLLTNIGRYRQMRGRYEEAEQMNRRALEGREKVLGREHPDTLTSIHNLGWVLRSQGKYEEAEQMNRRALEGCEKVLGREHPHTLTSVSNLASVLQDQGKYKEAEQMHRRALEAREKVLGREHPDTLTSIHNLGWVLRSQGKYEEAEQMNRRALEGHEKGKYEEAEQMNRRALEGCEKVLGREHPHTLTSIYNLAYLLHRQACFSDAGLIEVPLVVHRAGTRSANSANLDNQIATYLNIYSDSHVGTIVVAGSHDWLEDKKIHLFIKILQVTRGLSRYGESCPELTPRSRDAMGTPLLAHRCYSSERYHDSLQKRPAGFGKTILCARVVKHLSSIPETLSPILILTFYIAFDTSIFPGERH